MPRMPRTIFDKQTFKKMYLKNMYIELFDLLLDVMIEKEIYEIENNKRQEEIMKIGRDRTEEVVDRAMVKFDKLLEGI